ncbi:NAD(P)-dependent oxidoreductase [Dyella sp. LX-66]|uniref:NAD(P)-dependent oxidoreductase n=1 Tax=unclassified Dyella TaxID=2634549 RepID=UPI001BDFC0FD|nr:MULTISPECIES: NAD(P)-dependent oxidoreductase [unclassified Dyella]MBT2119179.1 NAD(P)-dependent oxidoreductase [Dyella sp. LX-1]MBT2141550.1 NAD(P)-dependent oxidoreductase [Dyella sp. LX-66]
MKIALFGATGHIGQGILDEALARGYDVVAVVRDATRLPQKNAKLTVVTGDVAKPESWSDAVRGADAAVASLSARRDGDPELVPANARVLIGNLPKAGVQRLFWVGGAGTLEVAPGKRVIDDAHFPAAWKPEAEAQGKALEVFRASQGITWTYLSPAALIEPGERTGKYRVGGEQLLVDAQGNSRISIADYAAGLLDRVEKRDAENKRITLAY